MTGPTKRSSPPVSAGGAAWICRTAPAVATEGAAVGRDSSRRYTRYLPLSWSGIDEMHSIIDTVTVDNIITCDILSVGSGGRPAALAQDGALPEREEELRCWRECCRVQLWGWTVL